MWGDQGLVTQSSADLKSVVAQGDRRASLEALRDHLAEALVEALDKDKASIAGRLHAILDAIDAIPTVREDSVADQLASAHTDELAKRRAGRPAA